MSNATHFVSDESAAQSKVTQTGGQAIARALMAKGVKRGFCVPGESYSGILHAFGQAKDEFDLVVCRHEGGASYMAQAYGRMTGKPGLCMVTRGPGACNALIGVSTAAQESTPMILIIGYVTTGTAGRFPFQGIDPQAVFGSVAKWVGVVERAEDIPHMIGRALSISTSGRPGPVVLAVPDNVQFTEIAVSRILPARRPGMAPSGACMDKVAVLLSESKKPLVLLGGTGWDQAACDDLATFAAAWDLPVSTTFRRNDLIDFNHPSYIGSFNPGPHPELVTRARDCDLLLLIGGRLSELETGRYEYLCAADEARTVIHAAALSDEFGETLQPDLAVVSDVAPFNAALAELPVAAGLPDAGQREALRSSFLAYTRPVDFGDKMNPGNGVKALQSVLPDKAIICVGAGNYTHFVLRHHKFEAQGTLLAPLSAPMGYSVPAAVAAAMENPQQEVVAYVGDGCFLMNPQELLVAAKRNLKLTVVMFNNGMYGSIKMHQEMAVSGMNVAVMLDNPDFQAMTQSMGLKTRQLTQAEAIAGAYQALRKETQGPIFIELITDPDVINPQLTLAQIRANKRK
ncbi:MAG: thiamine pyrophosphate-binding protein [Pseudomonadales bacterium]|nr:thiamine pyrophosphate-binding protein [Pseudomonadales bacterium]